MTDGDEMRQWGGGEGGGGGGGRRQRREFIVYFVPAAAAAAQHEKWTPTRRVQQISNCELFNWLDLDATRTTHSFIRTRWWLSLHIYMGTRNCQRQSTKTQRTT